MNGIDANVLDYQQAIYWYCNDFHGGQFSKEYEILCNSLYEPGPLENGPTSEISKDIYNLIVEDIWTIDGCINEMNLLIAKECGDIYSNIDKVSIVGIDKYSNCIELKVKFRKTEDRTINYMYVSVDNSILREIENILSNVRTD